MKRTPYRIHSLCLITYSGRGFFFIEGGKAIFSTILSFSPLAQDDELTQKSVFIRPTGWKKYFWTNEKCIVVAGGN
jgi:hypothetical protein